MPVKHEYYAILVVDIEQFGRRRNPVQSWLREQLYEILDEAFDGAGIDHRAGPAPVDRGDGLFWLLPGSVPKEDLTGPFVDQLRQGLRAHARTSNAEGALRLRVALHGGEVGADGRGWVGADLNTACRMVDHQPLREALAAAEGAELVVAVSDEWHRKVISHGYPGIEPADYRPVRFDAKEIRAETVWLRVPGHPLPAGPEGAPEPAPARTAVAASAAAEATPHVPPQPPYSHNSGIGQWNGDNEGGVVIAHGPVTQYHGGSRPDGEAAPAREQQLREELERLRALLKSAQENQEIDTGTYQDASRQLDTADEVADQEDEEGRGRLLRSLTMFGALVTGVGSVAEAVQRLLGTLRGGQ
ncbi:hypothetical protein [Streptomyces boncukensis]|uniref:Guanylate cyclase domain-containing protein n=1 Tax=Streptomyces boncukensis TaxID=2711219 RepID=A0A6G4WWZ5_9ACTN|nr:hypothetical protein [Streptomyces boncukensis]NGO69044.1 hypothetical protein [Streptomyces boncukensis]